MPSYDFDKGCIITLENIKLHYSYLDPKNPDTKWAHVWCTTCELTPDQITELTALGFNVKEGKLKVSRKVVNMNGDSQDPPKIFEKDGVTQSFDYNIGNGTTGSVEIWCKKWPQGTYVSAYLNKVQVIDRKVYSAFKDHS